jgi:two-component system nitrate/nitrite response regulator NarL
MVQITHQDRVALQLMAEGKTTDEIGHRLSIREGDVETYLSTLCEAMGAASRTEAIAAAQRRGLLVS